MSGFEIEVGDSKFLFKWKQRRRTLQPPLVMRPQEIWELDLLNDLEEKQIMEEIHLAEAEKIRMANENAQKIQIRNAEFEFAGCTPFIVLPLPAAYEEAATSIGIWNSDHSDDQPYDVYQNSKKLRNQKRNIKPSPACAFCRNNGHSPAVFKGHLVKNPITGVTTCPFLRALPPCRKCGAHGDRAHTHRYCPKNQPDFSKNFFPKNPK